MKVFGSGSPTGEESAPGLVWSKGAGGAGGGDPRGAGSLGKSRVEVWHPPRRRPPRPADLTPTSTRDPFPLQNPTLPTLKFDSPYGARGMGDSGDS